LESGQLACGLVHASLRTLVWQKMLMNTKHWMLVPSEET
jgi:hypothetical protein